jgi:hypothetical protein
MNFPALRLVGLGIVVVASSATLTPKVARADHQSYVYRGQCVDFPGEPQMIAALELLERGFFDHGRDPYHRAVARAIREIRCARYDVETSTARCILGDAIDELDTYIHGHALSHLDNAALLIHKALRVEREAFLSHAHHHEHGHGHGHTPVIVERHVVPMVPAPSRTRVRVYFGGSGAFGGFSFGN